MVVALKLRNGLPRAQSVNVTDGTIRRGGEKLARDVFQLSEELADNLVRLIDLPLFDSSQRLAISDVACSMSFEHWSAIRNLLKAGMLPSAVVVHRAQFEALLRSIWILYIATEHQLNKLAAELTIETELGAKNMPQVAEMLLALSKKGPPQAYEALNRFKENSWLALNSYAHAGIHPIRRHADGYPEQLIEGIVRNSNGLAIVSAMQASVLSGVQPLQREILDLAAQYPSCMPPPL